MEDTSIATGRSKRQKSDKHGRFAALERLKNLKGSKNKCSIGQIENVYDEVDEKEYSKRVLERQDDDWIEDDGGDYVEDGREIFDDDLDEESIREKTQKAKTRGTKKHLSENGARSSKSIRSLIANMPVKRKTVLVKPEDDTLLGDLMEEIANDSVNSPSASLSSKDYLKSLQSKTISSNIIKPKLNITKLPSRTLGKYPTERNQKIQKQNPVEQKVLEEDPVDDEMELDVAGLGGDDGDDVEIGEATEMDTSAVDTTVDLTKLEMDEFEDADMSQVPVEQNLPAGSDKATHDSEAKPVLEGDDWWKSCQSENCNMSQPPVSVDTGSLPMWTNEQGDKVFRFYWWDAYEDPFKQPGVVFLFGKVYIESAKTHVSCCVTVKNISRRIFLLPREKKLNLKTNTLTSEPVTPLDVYQEFNEKIANTNKIMNFKSRKVVRKYAFEMKDVPAESDYLEVKYPATYGKLPSELSGETFSHVFGTNTNSLELLLVERKIRGPCWLEVRQPQPAAVTYSWCKMEVVCSAPEELLISSHVAPPPPLVVMTVNLRTVVNPKNMHNEVVMIGCLVHNEYKVDRPAPSPVFQSHFCAFTHPSDVPWPFDWKRVVSDYKGTQTFPNESERSLLGFFLTKLFLIDPDVIVGHDLYGFTLDALLHRIDHHKVANWSRLGRLKRAVLPQTKGKQQLDRNLTCGRLVCDTNVSAKELIRARSYDLEELCRQVLHVSEGSRQDHSLEEVKGMFLKSSSIVSLLNSTMQDASYVLRLMYELNVLPLALQITNIAGNVMSRTLLGGRSERNEYLLLHAFIEKDFIVPDKTFGKKKIHSEENDMEAKASKKKPQYAGGLVLEPKKGFYDKYILLMDFNSLYPSIIQEYNICFTTVTRTEDEDEQPDVPSSNLPDGILPIEIRKLVESRRQVKALMKSECSPELKMQYNIRQMALKLTANSMYGCLGFAHSRFYAKPLAALVTSRGRDILVNTKDIVQKMNFEVIYGDTDSIMINTNCVDYDQVFKVGHRIKQEVNKLYRHVELEVDGVFKYMLLLKKKKYAAILMSKKPSGEIITTKEYKGLDIVRRDWSQLSAEVGRHILDQILSDQNPDERISNIREHLEKVAQDMRDNVVPIPLLSITKQLAKNPEDYPDKKSLPHLQVAMRLNSKGGRKIKAGDTVAYVICDDGSNLPAVQRAYHVDEVRANENLLIDVQYYLAHQIHPVVSRLCEPVDGADPAFIAECLGLDPSSYKRAVQRLEAEDEQGDYTLINDIQSFKHCDKFEFTCMNSSCRTKIYVESPIHDNYPVLTRCRNPTCKTSPMEYLPSIQNTLQLTIRKYVEKLYLKWMVCEDPACPNRTRRVSMFFLNSFPVCSLCKKGLMYREYTNADLYYQLKYFEYMFNTKRVKIVMSPAVEAAYKSLHVQIADVLNQSAYRILDFSKIFKFTSQDKNRQRRNETQRSILHSQNQWSQL